MAHDISGTPVIDWALEHTDQVSGLVLLNTYYGHAPTLRVPEVIKALQSRWPLVRRAFTPLVNTDATFRRVYPWQLRRLVGDREVAAQFTPILMAQFLDQPSTRGPFLHLNHDMQASIEASTARLPELRRFPHPVVVAFGVKDYSLNPAVGEYLAGMFPRATVRPIQDATHFPQLDHPETVAEVILQTVDHPPSTSSACWNWGRQAPPCAVTTKAVHHVSGTGQLSGMTNRRRDVVGSFATVSAQDHLRSARDPFRHSVAGR